MQNVPYLDGLVDLPLLGLHAVADVAEEVDQELALDAVVDHHCGVGNVQDNEADYGDDDQDPSDHRTGTGRRKERGGMY